MIIHFKKPSTWESAYIHYWNADSHLPHSQWPGLKMSPEKDDGWCCFKLNLQTQPELGVSIVFNDGKASQTCDLICQKSEGWFMNEDFWEFNPDKFKRFAFPGGKYKALVMSFDDGSRQDERLISIFNPNGIKGTFHINSGLTEYGDKISLKDIAKTYAGHEISAHSKTHPYLDGINNVEQLREEIEEDRITLEKFSGNAVRGLAYPFGISTPKLLECLPKWGFIYGRVVNETNDFRLPNNLFRWRPSCHHSAASDLAKRFLADGSEDLKVLFIWGHSWELDSNKPRNNWHDMLEVCEFLGKREDIWYAGASELAEYLNAIQSVVLDKGGNTARNPENNKTVLIKKGGSLVALPPGESLVLKP